MKGIPIRSIDNPTAGLERYIVILEVNDKLVQIRTFARDDYHALTIAMGVAGYENINPEFKPAVRRIE